MRNLIQISIVVIVLGVAVAYWQNSKPTQDIDWEAVNKQTSVEDAGQWEGKTAPDFSLSNQQGKIFQLSQFKGRPVLLHFWATWCPPCVEEIPHLIKFAKWAKQKTGMEVLAISEDESWDKIKKFLLEKEIAPRGELPFDILLDTQSVGSGKFKCNQYPETFLINKNSSIIKKFIGAQAWDSEEMKKWVEQNF
jgi:peroxiredoxin